jgi:hypothetical protein
MLWMLNDHILWNAKFDLSLIFVLFKCICSIMCDLINFETVMDVATVVIVSNLNDHF